MKPHPVTILRSHFGKISELRDFSSVYGFSKLVDRSESLIRNVENRVSPLSKKLALAIENKTGVAASWFLQDEGDEEILAADGTLWEPRHTLSKVRTEISSNMEALAATMAIAEAGQSTLGELLAEAVTRAVKEEINKKSLDFLIALTTLLDNFGYLPQAKKESKGKNKIG